MILKQKHCQTNASALILALWALLLLSAAVFAWVKFIDQDIAIAGQANAEMEATAFAHSGVSVALHPNVTAMTPLLHKRFGQDRGYDVEVVSEAGKLNLKWLFQGAAGGAAAPQPRGGGVNFRGNIGTIGAGAQPAILQDPGAAGGADLAGANPISKIALFKRYLERHGLSFEERQTLVDCMLDWIDPDNLRRLNGAEEEPNYHPPNRGYFVSVDEIAQVRGSQPLVSQPGWQNDFTVYSQPGLIDLQSAPLAILEVLPNVGDANARRFLQIRQGPDKKDGTKDDHIFKSVDEALQYLGVSGAAAQALRGFVIVEPTPTIVHISSVGQSGKVYRQVDAVAGKVNGGQPSFLLWNEL